MSDESNNVVESGAADATLGAFEKGHIVAEDAEEGRIADPSHESGSGDSGSGRVEPAAVPRDQSADKFQSEPSVEDNSADASQAGVELDSQEVAEDSSAGVVAEERAEVAANLRQGARLQGIVESTESKGAVEESVVKKDWYILKVQSNRERSIAEALRRKIAIEGLEEYFGEVIVPTEKITEFKGGKKKVVERKLYPGYIVVHMCINDDTWFAVRETSGIGDFTGSGGKPTPMLAHEVARIIHKEAEEHDEAPKLDIRFKIKDRVKIKEGTFEGFEGDVNDIDEASGRVTVMINIFSRSTPVELEYWQIESV